MPLPGGLVQDLKSHRATQAEALLKLGVRSELAFTSETGGPLHWQNVIKRHFKKVLQEAELPIDFRFYSLRHSSATQLLRDGVSPKIVSARLGHGSVAFTLDVYVDDQADMQNEAVERQQKRFYGWANLRRKTIKPVASRCGLFACPKLPNPIDEAHHRRTKRKRQHGWLPVSC